MCVRSDHISERRAAAYRGVIGTRRSTDYWNHTNTASHTGENMKALDSLALNIKQRDYHYLGQK